MNTTAAFFEQDLPFCSNPHCPLHVVPGMPGVEGAGNWARLASGLVLDRQLVDGSLVCDACAHQRSVRELQ